MAHSAVSTACPATMAQLGGGGIDGSQLQRPETIDPAATATSREPSREAATPLEVQSWYAIDWSNSVYSTVGISGFLPLLLQAAALSAAGFPAVCQNVSADPVLLFSLFPPIAGQPDVTSAYMLMEGPPTDVCSSAVRQCVGNWCPGAPPTTNDCRYTNSTETFPLRAHALGSSIDPTAYATLSLALSVGAQAAVFILIGAASDYGSNRKRILVAASVVGGVACCACAGIGPATWWLGAVLMLTSNVCFGITTICYNAYLPLLVEALPEVRRARAMDSTAVQRQALIDEKSNELSSKGFAWGYVAGVVGILLSIPGAATLPEIESYQIAMLLTGVWWLVFMLVPWRLLLPRPGPPLPPGKTYLGQSVRQLCDTMATMQELPVTGCFLLWWMIGSDAIFTVGTMGGLFAATQVRWGCLDKTIGILCVFLLVPIAAAIGNMGYLWLTARHYLSSKTALLMSMGCYIAIGLYALVGFVSEEFGLRQGWEVIAFGAFYGLHIGAYQSLSRGAFAQLIPRGKEGAFYSMYELTNKGSSALGPVVLTIIQETTGDLRWGFVFIIINIALPMWGISRLDLKAGTAMASAYSEKLVVVASANSTSSGERGPFSAEATLLQQARRAERVEAEAGALSASIACNGVDALYRHCVLRNVCVDTRADIGAPKIRHDHIVLFSGKENASSSSSAVPPAPLSIDVTPLEGTIVTNASAWRPLLTRDRLVSTGSLNHGGFIFRPRVEAGPIPLHRVATWREEPLILLSRHFTSNFAHNLVDDIFPLTKLARKWLRWDPVAARREGLRLNSSSRPPILVGWLDWDLMGTKPGTQALYRALLPGMKIMAAQQIGTRLEQARPGPVGQIVNASADRPLVCFRGPVHVGMGGESIMRNSWHAFHKQWTFSNSGVDWPRIADEYALFVGHFRESYGLQPLESLPPAGTGNLSRRILIVNRGGPAIQGSAKRSIVDIDALEKAVRAVSGGRPVSVVDWGLSLTPENAAAVDSADLVIAIHGAGNMMMLGARPGAAWLELFPPRADVSVGIYLALALRQRLRYSSHIIRERQCNPEVHFQMQPDFLVDAADVATHAAHLLSLSSSSPALPPPVLRLPPNPGPLPHPLPLGAPPAPQVLLLLPSDGPRFMTEAAATQVLGVLTMLIATDSRPHAFPPIPLLRGDTAQGVPASVVDTRIVRVVDPFRKPPPPVAVKGAAPRAAATSPPPVDILPLAKTADLVIGIHGTAGLETVFQAVRPGTVVIDLLPPRTPERALEYLPLARASGAALHFMMLTEKACNGSAYEGGAYTVNNFALASMVALTLHTEM